MTWCSGFPGHLGHLGLPEVVQGKCRFPGFQSSQSEPLLIFPFLRIPLMDGEGGFVYPAEGKKSIKTPPQPWNPAVKKFLHGRKL